MVMPDDELMEQGHGYCEHRWRYFVHVASRAVRVRECENCGKRGVIPMELSPLPRKAAGEKVAV